MNPTNTDSQRLHEFNHNLQTHRNNLVTCIAALTTYKHDAEDVMQRAAVTMWRKYDTFKAGTDFFKWAIQISRYELCNFSRVLKRRDRLSYGETYELAVKRTMQPEEPYNEIYERIENVLLTLPKDMVDLLLAVYVDGHDVKTIAASHGKAPRTYYNKLTQLRKKIINNL